MPKPRTIGIGDTPKGSNHHLVVAPVEIVENLDAGLFERFFYKFLPVENLWKNRGYFPQGIYT